MILPIVQTPNEVLTQKAKLVPKITKDIHALIQDMKDTLDTTVDPIGVGLAAPQIGKSLQIFIVKPTEKSKVEVFINPTIEVMTEQPTTEPKPKKRKRKTSIKLEGCLSMPTIWGNVKRSTTVTVSYLDEKGIKHTQIVKGFKATIIQHEYDHLQGFLFSKRVLEQKGKLYKSKKDKDGEELFEEIEL